MENILLLPDEIKIKIFQYLNGVDKIETSRVCEDFQRIGVDRKILQCLDFSYNYKFTLTSHLKFIGRKVTCDLVTILNLNGIYWITSAKLQNCVIKFENLNALHVVDTQLSYQDIIMIVSNKLDKVRKLAFSLRPDNCGDVHLINIKIPITHLYVTFYSHQIKRLFRLMSNFSDLEELWMIEPSYPYKILQLDCMNQKTVTKIPKINKRIVISQRHAATIRLDHFSEYYVDGLDYPNNWETVIVTENKYNYFMVLENQTNKNTNQNDGFNVRCLEKYVTINDIKNIRNTDNAQDIKLIGLNFDKNYPDINDHLKTILTESTYTSSLKKWRGSSECFWEEKQMEGADTTLFKRRRIGVSTRKLNENSLFACFTRHTPQMEDFEILDENNESLRKQLWQIDSLSFAQNWKILKSLTITSVNIKNGKFIIDVLKHCTLLNCLKIQDKSFQDDFSADLCNGLQHAMHLKDFRYERKGSLTIDKLFDSLKACKKLERVYVQCRSAPVISKKPIKTVLTVCKNLIYFFLYISELPETVCRSIRKNIDELSLKPHQIVLIKGVTFVMDTIIYKDMPMFHIEDMVCQSNNFHSNFIRSGF